MPRTRRYRRRGRLSRNQASQVARISKQVLFRNSETKLHCQTNTVGDAVGTTPENKSLSAIGQGDNNGQRIGQTINPIYFKMRFHISPQDGYNAFRIILLQKKDNASLSAFAGTSTLSCLGQNFKQHFKVLVDKTYTQNSQLASGLSSSPVREWTISSKKLSKMSWASTSSGVVQPDSGALFLHVVSDSTLEPYPLLFYDTMLYYKDM